MKRPLRLGGIWLFSLFIALAFGSAQAPGQQVPELMVRGKIGGAGVRYLDLATIMALPSVTFSSVDPWDAKQHSFTGVPLNTLLASLGIEKSATSLVLTARNNYRIPIKREDYEEYGYILAYMIDGRLFSEDPSTSMRGPLFIAIDFSRHKTLSMDVYKHQLVWQLSEILVQ